jgi:hypothetical protein
MHSRFNRVRICLGAILIVGAIQSGVGAWYADANGAGLASVLLGSTAVVIGALGVVSVAASVRPTSPPGSETAPD